MLHSAACSTEVLTPNRPIAHTRPFMPTSPPALQLVAAARPPASKLHVGHWPANAHGKRLVLRMIRLVPLGGWSARTKHVERRGLRHRRHPTCADQGPSPDLLIFCSATTVEGNFKEAAGHTNILPNRGRTRDGVARPNPKQQPTDEHVLKIAVPLLAECTPHGPVSPCYEHLHTC